MRTGVRLLPLAAPGLSLTRYKGQALLKQLSAS
jgi:hypothetical protein